MVFNSDDIGWFKPADLKKVFEQIQQLKQNHGREIILIGGQAIYIWAIKYEIELPEVSTPAITQDLDFLGYKQEAEALARLHQLNPKKTLTL